MSRLYLILLWIIYTPTIAQTSTTPANNTDAFWNTNPASGLSLTKLGSGTNNAPEPSLFINEVITRQAGINNTAILSVVSSSPNRLEVNQTGVYNYTDVALSGANNSVLLNQTGGNNNISLGLNGVNNRYILTQDGDDRIQMLGRKQDNAHLQINQGSGSNNLTITNTALSQGANGTGIANLRIDQSGGATVMIQNGRLFGN